jgi:hypothetical protein
MWNDLYPPTSTFSGGCALQNGADVLPSGVLNSSFRFHLMLSPSEIWLRSHEHHWQWEGKNEAAWLSWGSGCVV